MAQAPAEILSPQSNQTGRAPPLPLVKISRKKMKNDIKQVIEEPDFGKIVVSTGAELEKIKKREEDRSKGGAMALEGTATSRNRTRDEMIRTA